MNEPWGKYDETACEPDLRSRRSDLLVLWRNALLNKVRKGRAVDTAGGAIKSIE
jgi:hypothetical protein